MESYQPWPIFNVQNELAGVQKKRELQFKSGEWYTANFFQWMIELPPRNLPPPYPPLHSTHHITSDLFFFQSKGERGRGHLKVKIHVCTSFCLCATACLYVCGYTYQCWFCMSACFSVCRVGGGDAWRKCVSKMAHGVNLPHIRGHLWGERANWTDDLQQKSAATQRRYGRYHQPYICELQMHMLFFLFKLGLDVNLETRVKWSGLVCFCTSP